MASIFDEYFYSLTMKNIVKVSDEPLDNYNEKLANFKRKVSNFVKKQSYIEAYYRINYEEYIK